MLQLSKRMHYSSIRTTVQQAAWDAKDKTVLSRPAKCGIAPCQGTEETQLMNSDMNEWKTRNDKSSGLRIYTRCHSHILYLSGHTAHCTTV